MNAKLWTVGAFVVVCMCSALIGWYAGFDFEHGEPNVGFWVFMTLVMASGAAAIARGIFELEVSK